MFKSVAGLALGLALAAGWQAPDPSWRNACIQRCTTAPQLGDPEVERQEIVSLEKERRARHPVEQWNLLPACLRR